MISEQLKKEISELSDKIVRAMNLEKSESVADEMKRLVETRLNDEVMNVIVGNLTDEQLEMLSVELENGELTDEDKAELMVFYADMIPDFTTLLQNAILELYKKIMADVAEFKKVYEASALEKK